MVKEKTGEIELARAAFELALAGRKLVAAKRALDGWGNLVPHSTADWLCGYRDQLNQSLREAQAIAARARSRERTDPRTARELYRRSLSLASDLTEALTGLERCPPDTATELTAMYVDDRVRLRWSPPPPDGLGPITYVVLRKPEGQLQHPGDGVKIGEVSYPEFEDPNVTPGTSVSYAVLTKRGKVESVSAVAVGPMFLMGEVRDLRADTRQREVDLSWTPPPNAAEVRVARKRGSPPKSPLDGEYVASTLDQAHDSGLEPDRIYQYGVFAVFKTPEGLSTASRGTFITALPHTPIRPLDAPSLTTEPDGRVLLRWVEPQRGVVKIIRTSRPFPFEPGRRLTPVQSASLEGQWVELTSPDSAYDTPPTFGAFFYTPLTSWGGAATVGHSATHSCVLDPSDLRGTRIGGGGRVHLRWRWSPHGSQSLVVARQGTPPNGPDDPEATVETVHETDYSRLGYHALTLPPGESDPWHIAVYALSNVDGEAITSPGLNPTARTLVLAPNQEITLSYSFARKRLGGKRWSVTLRTEPAGSALPPLVLVTHPRTIPLSAEDGSIVAEFPAARDGESLHVPPELNLGRARARVFPDPRVDPAGLPPIRLRHPETGTARV